jgi:5-methylcytosine-specific restriction protein A
MAKRMSEADGALVLRDLENQRVARMNERRAQGSVPAHRRGLPVPPYREPGQCRLCDTPILRPDGQPNRRRLWHQECADLYMASNSAAGMRAVIFKRDGGICAKCGKDCGRNGDWEADHVVPLIDGGTHDFSNVQTLCTPDHKAKTAAEAKARAAQRRAAADTHVAMPLGEEAVDG